MAIVSNLVPCFAETQIPKHTGNKREKKSDKTVRGFPRVFACFAEQNRQKPARRGTGALYVTFFLYLEPHPRLWGFGVAVT